MRIDTALIRVKELNVKIGHNLILENIDFSIASGEIVTLVGPNGAGKSTFVRSLIGAIPEATGIVKIKSNLKIGYVPQKMKVNPSLPMSVNRFLNLPKKINSEKLQNALTKAGISKLGNYQLSNLSSGEIQRVLLAYALKDEPELLILDEASQGLDHLGAIAFYQQIEELRKNTGCAVLMVSHELHVVMAASDRVICLNSHICCEGAPEEVARSKEYYNLFGKESLGTMAIYRHQHDHNHNQVNRE